MEVPLEEANDPDGHRRGLLRASDRLLDEVEELRLADQTVVPPQLRQSIDVLRARLGRSQPATAPATLRAAHNLILAVQARLMAANPRVPAPNAHAGRAAGTPAVVPLAETTSWKVLTLPPASVAESPEHWEELIEATIERAYQRWLYTHHHFMAAIGAGQAPGRRWAWLRAAWTNYWELSQEARRLLSSAEPPRRL